MAEPYIDWFILLEDYFGLRVDDPHRWESELKKVKRDLHNQFMCDLIRSNSHKISGLFRKVTLSDLKGWIKESRDGVATAIEGCDLCRSGWVDFAIHGGAVVVCEPTGYNHAACPCTCAAGDAVMDLMVENQSADGAQIKKLQALVIEAMKKPKRIKPVAPEHQKKETTEPGEGDEHGKRTPF